MSTLLVLANGQRASGLADTQKEAIDIAKKLNPGHSPDVERVRHTKRRSG